jgi:hypothetical protein
MSVFEISWQFYLVLFCCVVGMPVLCLWAWCYYRKGALKPVLWSVIAATTVFMGLTWAISSNSVVIEENHLALQAGFYQAQIDNIGLASSAIHIMPTDQLGEYSPEQTVNGIRLPGYQVGWYLLHNRKLAFVMLIGSYEEVSLIRSGEMTAVVGGNVFSSAGRVVAAR